MAGGDVWLVGLDEILKILSNFGDSAIQFGFPAPFGLQHFVLQDFLQLSKEG